MFRQRIHDGGEKTVLGHKINAGGIRDGETVIAAVAVLFARRTGGGTGTGAH